MDKHIHKFVTLTDTPGLVDGSCAMDRGKKQTNKKLRQEIESLQPIQLQRKQLPERKRQGKGEGRAREGEGKVGKRVWEGARSSTGSPVVRYGTEVGQEDFDHYHPQWNTAAGPFLRFTHIHLTGVPGMGCVGK